MIDMYRHTFLQVTICKCKGYNRKYLIYIITLTSILSPPTLKLWRTGLPTTRLRQVGHKGRGSNSERFSPI